MTIGTNAGDLRQGTRDGTEAIRRMRGKGVDMDAIHRTARLNVLVMGHRNAILQRFKPEDALIPQLPPGHDLIEENLSRGGNSLVDRPINRLLGADVLIEFKQSGHDRAGRMSYGLEGG